jgi:hypothetical protein
VGQPPVGGPPLLISGTAKRGRGRPPKPK